MRAEDVTGIANKVAKGGERTQELIHKAIPTMRYSFTPKGF
jgi:(2Fe-2S) ferredoxin